MKTGGFYSIIEMSNVLAESKNLVMSSSSREMMVLCQQKLWHVDKNLIETSELVVTDFITSVKNIAMSNSSRGMTAARQQKISTWSKSREYLSFCHERPRHVSKRIRTWLKIVNTSLLSQEIMSRQ